MTYTMVDGYSEDREALLDGQSFPVPSLLKNGSSRVLFMDGETVPVSIWAAASLSGVHKLIRPNGSWIDTTEFIDLAELYDSEALYRVHEFMWHPGGTETTNVAQNGSEGLQDTLQEFQDVFGEEESVEDVKAAFEAGEPFVTGKPEDLTEPDQASELEGNFVHLHTHSEFSALDGLATVNEIVAEAKRQGNTAVAITDHGGCWGHPDFQKACDKEGIKPIFGIEAYLVDDRFNRPDKDYYHITLWAMNNVGLLNIWAMSTEGYRDAESGKPCIDWDTLTRLNEGVIASSGCLRGPLAHEITKGNVFKAQTNSNKLTEIFGDRYYIELHVNHLDIQIEVNKWLTKHAEEFDIPMIAAVDSHYATHDQKDDHQVWLSVQTGKDVDDESSLFAGGQDYHMADEETVFEKLAYLGPEVAVLAIDQTVKLANRCDARITPKLGMPMFHAGENAEQRDIDKMLDDCLAAWDTKIGYKDGQTKYVERFEREFPLLAKKGFAGYFLMNADLTRYAKDNNVLVGPGRGSGAGSLVAYLLGITEVDPVENDLLFERFMTEGRTALPDFDIDYPSSKKQFMREYAEKRWGKKHVCAVGTVTRLKNKGAFKKTASAISSRLPDDYFTDVEKISKIITAAEASTAGLGLKWDELMDACEDDFAPFKRKYPYLFEMAAKFRGRVQTYSRHAAGLILDPQSNLEGALPMMSAEDTNGNRFLVTQFDKDVLEELGYVKFDFLNLRNLDTLQITVDLIEEQLGERVDVYGWRDEYHDDNVFAEIRDGWTLGMFQIETSLGTRTVKQLRPNNLNDLADCITLGRPGPIRSGLDKTYFKRREGKERVSYADPRLEAVLSRTYGTMIYQEDIMATCMVLAGYDDNEADKVRKILGKKKPEEAKKEGVRFIERAIEHETVQKIAETLWTQMEEFSRYSFNRAHAFAYAVLAYWTAWFKIHYPIQFATAILSTIDKEEVPDWISETRRLGFKVLPPDINESGFGFKNTADAVRYSLDSVKGVGSVATKWITENQPFVTWDDFMTRRDTERCDMGVVKKLAHIGAFDSLVPNRKALEAQFEEDERPNGERCIFYDLHHANKYNALPCHFDWDTIPLNIGRTGKPIKDQEKGRKPPAKCSKACRKWTPREFDAESVEPYTESEIRQIEIDTLGIYLSSSPFDIISDDDRALLSTANQIQTEPSGNYLTAIMISRVKQHRTRNDDPMAFVTAETASGTMDITVFKDKLAAYGKYLQPGQMALAEVNKNDRGITLRMLEAI